MPGELRIIVTTVATREQARALARSLVEARLAACAQISEIESLYRWQGAIEQEAEFRVVFKTTAERQAAAMAAIAGQHPYELPAIHALAADAVDPRYAAWVAGETDAAKD